MATKYIKDIVVGDVLTYPASSNWLEIFQIPNLEYDKTQNSTRQGDKVFYTLLINEISVVGYELQHDPTNLYMKILRIGPTHSRSRELFNRITKFYGMGVI